MTEKGMENNKVTVIGTIVSGFTFSHAVFGEGFYLVDLLVNRLSEQADIIPLMISERLIDVTKDYQGCTMEASGQFRSYNRHEGTKNRLVLSVFVREVRFMEEFTDYTKTNQIFLDGYICKEPVYRKTPLGTRILIWGRVQSRESTKKVSETECEKRVAYEVSVSKLECADHAES